MAEKVVKSKTNNKRTNLPYEIENTKTVLKVLGSISERMNYRAFASDIRPQKEIMQEYIEKINTRLAIKSPYTDMIASRLRYCNDRGIFGLVAIAKSLFQGKIIDREIENRERQRLREELLKSNVAVVQSFSETLRSGNYNQYAIDLEKQRALTLTEEGIKAINAQKEQMETIKQKIVNGKNKAIGYIRALIGDGKLKLEENKSKKAKEKGPVIPLVQAEPVL